MKPTLLMAFLGLTTVLTMGAPRVSAQEGFFPLIVNGSRNLDATYDKGILVVRFHRTRKGAGSPTTYVQNVPPGSAAWVDRPLNNQEPIELRQRMSEQRAAQALERLKQNGGYWKFFCRNTGNGFFEVSRSERTNASVRIDDSRTPLTP